MNRWFKCRVFASITLVKGGFNRKNVGALPCRRVHIWFVTSRAGGPIHIKTNRTESPRRKCRLRRSAQGLVGSLHPWNTHIPKQVLSISRRHVNMKVSSIDGRRLRKIIRKECGRCLIVDCRSYFSFSSSSIRGSVNVNLNSVVVRRSRGGPVPLQFVIPDEKALFRLREGSISAVVALDDRTPHLQKLKKDSIAHIVINTLSHLAGSASVCFLKGEWQSINARLIQMLPYTLDFLCFLFIYCLKKLLDTINSI